MAQSVNLWGATYSDVPAVTVPKSGGGTCTFTDVTDTTATASDVASGKYFYTAAGTKTQGTGTSGGYITQDENGYIVLAPTGDAPTLITKSITQNGTYNASSDNATGYSSVSVNVSGGSVNKTINCVTDQNTYQTLTVSGVQSEPSKFLLLCNNTSGDGYVELSDLNVASVTYDGTNTKMFYVGNGSYDHINFSGLLYDRVTWSYNSNLHTVTFSIVNSNNVFFAPSVYSEYYSNGYTLYYI